jgi:hypothetical protein
MGLINLYTDLKSLKFGKDRIGGGSSNQPYIKTPIPEKIGEFGYLNQDFILRGGSRAVTDSALDVVRLGKYFTDLRNPSGLLFIAKQNLLSRMAVRTQSSTGILNEGIYTPLSTLLQAGGVAFGLHLNKQGINPFSGLNSPGTATPNKYEDTVKNTNTPFTTATTSTTTSYKSTFSVVGTENYSGPGGLNVVSTLPTYNEFTVIKNETTTVNNVRNRLVSLWNDKIVTNDENPFGDMLSYQGGPGSVLGIGKTNIRFADQRTGLNNPNYGKDPVYQAIGYQSSNKTKDDISFSLIFEGASRLHPGINNQLTLVSSPSSKTGIGSNWFYAIGGGGLASNNKAGIGGVLTEYTDPYNPEKGPINSITGRYTGDSATYTKDDLLNDEYTSTYTDNQKIKDFRNILRGRINSTASEILFFGVNPNNVLSSAPDYETKSIEKRVLLGDPGYRAGKNLKSYVNGINPGKIVGKSGGNASYQSYDKINASYIYQSENGAFGKNNDLVKFAIGVVDNNNPSKKNYLHFRAFINQISDVYSSDWSPTKYIGRGENFYTYNGFDRKVSLSWTVAAQSKAELIPMYKKLNYLASVVTPDYSPNGYMRGNIVTLTIGGYFYEQPGIINSFSYEMNDDDSSWEIGINEVGGSDSKVKELPHIIKVTGFSFTPIHTFVPRKQNLVGLTGDGISPDLVDPNKYGPERYIALDQGDADKNNYGTSTPWKTPSVPKKESVPVTPTPAPTPAPTPGPGPTPNLTQNFPNVLATPTYLTTPVTNGNGTTPVVTVNQSYDWGINPAKKVVLVQR